MARREGLLPKSQMCADRGRSASAARSLRMEIGIRTTVPDSSDVLRTEDRPRSVFGQHAERTASLIRGRFLVTSRPVPV